VTSVDQLAVDGTYHCIKSDELKVTPTGPFKVQVVKGLESNKVKDLTITPAIKFSAFLVTQLSWERFSYVQVFASKLLGLSEDPQTLKVYSVTEKCEVTKTEELYPDSIVYLLSSQEFETLRLEWNQETVNPFLVFVLIKKKPNENVQVEEVPKKEILVDIKLLKRLSEIFPKVEYEQVKEILLKHRNNSDSASLDLLEISEQIPSDGSQFFLIFLTFSL
jgi:hypothetical protein